MADSKLTALSELSVPALEDLTYVVDDPGGTPASNKLTLARLAGFLLHDTCQGRLTLESGVPVSTSDQTAKTSVYFTPYNGEHIALFDGTRWKLYAFTELTLALGTLSDATNYDVFCYDNAGTLTLELSAAWTNGTTRADALTTQDGVYVKSGATTRRYLGTIRTTSTTTTEDSGGGSSSQVGGKRFVWNRYNQVPHHMAVIDTTDNWSYSTDTIRQANGASGNKVEFVIGDAEVFVQAQALGLIYAQNNVTYAAKVGVGLDTTSAFTSKFVQGGYNQDASNGVYAPITGTYRGFPGLGYHYLSWNEKGGHNTSTFLGDNGGDSQQSGLSAILMG